MAIRCIAALVLLSLLLDFRCKVTAQGYVERPGLAIDDDEFGLENDIIRLLVPKIRNAVQDNLPECYGNGKSIMKTCTPGSSHKNFVFYENKQWVYKVFAKYIDKVNTLSIEHVELGQNNGNLTITVSGAYPKEALASDIYVGECFTFNQCGKIWDNARNFAKGYSLTMRLTFDCQSGIFVLSSNSNVALDIDPSLKVNESIGSIDFDIEDITNAVREALKKLILKEMMEKIILLPKSFTIAGITIPLPAGISGENMSVTDLPNIISSILPHSKIRRLCLKNLQ